MLLPNSKKDLSIYNSYINSAVSILKIYKETVPFHFFLKKYFSANKKFGSNDRKQIASLCYSYFRLGHVASALSMEERILLGIFLCENKSSELLQSVKPEWNDLINKPVEEKYSIFYIEAFKDNIEYSIESIFPFKNELSNGIDANKFNQSFLVQPKLFLRLRPGFHKPVIKKLEEAGLQFALMSENCVALYNSSKIDSIVELNLEAVVQDYNSQRIAEFLQLSTINPKLSTKVWDCCAGSGGKSIMAFDINPDIQLTVSDKRELILQNLHKRFRKAGIKKYNAFVADLSKGQVAFSAPAGQYDLIICDAPCTGSGTWARTPEQLRSFNKSVINKYANLQKQIIGNVIPYVKRGGHFLYITCSVFKKENEEIVKFAESKFGLELKKVELLKGYEIQADTMFTALFIAP